MSDRVTPVTPNGPVTDPTALTREALQRDIASATKLIEAKLAEERSVQNGRYDFLTSVLAERKVTLDSQFHNVAERFDFIENVRIEQKSDSKKNIEDALLAAKEALREQKNTYDSALTKTEAALKEQANQRDATTNARILSIEGVMNDVKSRVDRMEATKIGAGENKSEVLTNRTSARGDFGLAISVAVGLVGFAALAISAIALITR